MMPIVTLLEVQKRQKDRVNVFLDGEFAFGLNLMDAATLRKGQDLSEVEITALREKDDVQKAMDRAMRFLSYRPRSIQEVRQNLVKAGNTETIIDAAIARLSDMRYLDDRAFASYWVENRNTFKPMGPRALQYELRQKGISSAIIDEVLDDLVDVDESAYAAASTRVRRYRGRSRKEFEQKIGSFLQRRGFSYQTTRDVLNRMIQEAATDFFADEDE